MCDRFGTDTRKGGGNLGPGNGDASINQNLPVTPAQNRDVAAGSFEYGDVFSDLVDGDRGLGGLGLDQLHDTVCLGKSLTSRKPSARRCEGRCRHAAKAKAAT